MAVRFNRDRLHAAKDTMDDPNDQTRSEGDGGSWYLEAVGGTVASPPPPYVLEPRRPADSQDPAVTAGAEPDDAGAGPAESTAELVGQMWRATGEPDPLSDWQPSEMSKTMGRRRNFRWSLVITLVIVLAVVAAGAVWLPRIAERQADAKAAEYAAALIALRRELPATQQLLATLTEPATDAETLSAVVPDLARLQTAADEVARQAVEPLPEPIPLLPRGALEALEPSRDAMGRAATGAGEIVAQVTEGITYRSLASTLLAGLPTLPVEADAAATSDLNVTLSEIYADATGILAELPGLAAFADHREQAGASVDTFFDLQVDYVEALRNGDSAAATILADEMVRLPDRLVSALVPGLAELRSSVDAAILELDRSLAAAINALPD
jgi:hypothetical protein